MVEVFSKVLVHWLNIHCHFIGTGDNVAVTTQCLTDVFSVTNQNNLPQICGTMTGEHVYFDASEQCNSLDFQLGDNAIGISALATRSVSMKVY